MTDTVTLSIPRDPRYYAVARLVVGGMAAPLEMSYDALDDLQLAISSLLDHDGLVGSGELKLRLSVSQHELAASLGPFPSGSVADAFERSSTTSGALGLRSLLETVVDSVDVEPEGGDEWVTLKKQVHASV